MAEYYTVVKKVIGRLEANTAQTRRTAYGEVRTALIGELKAVAPPLSMAEIAAQRLELEEAIRRVERESAANPQPPRAPARPAAPPPTPNLARMVPSPAPASAPGEDGRSPPDLFRRGTQQAESRGSPTGVTAPLAPAAVSKSAEPNQAGAATADRQPTREPVIERASPSVPGDREPTQPQPPTIDAGAALAPQAADSTAAAAQPRPADLAAADQPRPADPTAAAERRRAQKRDDPAKATEPEARPPRLRSRLLAALIIVLVVGAGALVWSKRAIIGQTITAFDDGRATSGKPIPPTVPDSGALGNAAERVTDPGPAPAEVVRPVNPRKDDVASAAVPAGAGVAANPALPAVAGARPVPAGPAADEASPAGPAPTAPAVASAADADGAAAGPKAILHEEMVNSTGDPSVGATSLNATVTWRYLENGADGPAIEADLQVPERRLKIKLTIRKNTDTSLPASHLVEIKIDAPPDLPGKSIQQLTRLLMKPTEEVRGQPLAGAAAKITDGFFWIALSGADLDAPHNLALLGEGEWIDLTFTYATGQRAILTFEKGAQGDQVFQKAMAAWASG